MRYIKRFNEEVSYTYGNDINFLKGLEDDIEGIFVQVLDDGWVLDYQLTDYAGNIGWIKLRKESGGESKTIEELLPYLHHFYDYIKSKGYDFHHINLFDWICVDYDRSKAAINFGRKDWDFIEQHLIAVADRRGRPVGSISMNLSHNFTSKDRTRNLNSYNESNSEVLDEQELQEFCELNLAFLVDEGLKVIVDDLPVNDFGYRVVLSFRAIGGMRWNERKDHMIPFLIRLKREYDLKIFDWVSSSPEADIVFQISMKWGNDTETYTDYLVSDRVIGDRIDRNWSKDSIYKIKEISFYIKNSKEL
jgi:hypothetical protein